MSEIKVKSELTIQGILDRDHPVGSVYISKIATSPASLFGGSWEQIKDVFLLASGSTYAAGTTGGEAAHTLSVSEMPAHTHDNGAGFTWRATTNSNSPIATPWGQKAVLYHESSYNSTGSTGGNGAHNNMPPYLTVYAWYRVS